MMIHETMIKYNDKVVIFNVYVDGKIDVVIINHHTFPTMKYSTESLKHIFHRLMSLKRKLENNMIIKHDGIKNDIAFS